MAEARKKVTDAQSKRDADKFNEDEEALNSLYSIHDQVQEDDLNTHISSKGNNSTEQHGVRLTRLLVGNRSKKVKAQ